MVSYIGNKKIKDFYLNLGKSQGVLDNPEKITGLTITQDPLNATIVGGVTIASGGILSNFSQSNYATIPYIINGNYNFEIVFKIKISSNANTWTNILANDTKDWSTAIHMFISNATNGFKLRLEVTSNGTSWNICNITGKTILNLNTWYWYKVTRIKSGSNIIYTMWYSTDGINYTNDGSITTTTTGLKGSASVIGTNLAHSDKYLRGSIDFSASYIKKDNVVVWRGGSRSSAITLKAHSIFYMPVGKELDYSSDEEIKNIWKRDNLIINRILKNLGCVFIEYKTISDITKVRYEGESTEGVRLIQVCINDTEVTLDGCLDHRPRSDTTYTPAYCCIYNYNENYIKYVVKDAVPDGYIRSLPIALVNNGNGLVFSKIKEVFKGITYFGRNLFALPELTLLIPNGLVNGCKYSNIIINLDTVVGTKPSTSSAVCYVYDNNGHVDFCAENIYFETGTQPTTEAYFWWNNITNKFNQKWWNGNIRDNGYVCYITKANNSTGNCIDSIEINYTKDTIKKLIKLYNGKTLIFTKS